MQARIQQVSLGIDWEAYNKARMVRCARFGGESSWLMTLMRLILQLEDGCATLRNQVQFAAA